MDGNDGTGKTTLVESLRTLGYDVKDRGMPTEATLSEVPAEVPKDEVYIILDAPEEVSRERLAKAGKDLNEHWHTMESLTLYRKKFREIAAILKVPLFPATETPGEMLSAVKKHLGIPPMLKIGIPKGRLCDSVAVVMRRANHALKIEPRNYHPACPNGLDPFFLKPRAIPQMVALGLLDGGFIGKDLVEESGWGDHLQVAVDLNTQRVMLVAAAADASILTYPPKKVLRIATEFPNIADRWATSKNLAHLCINTYGSTEAWVPEFCDIAVDVVESGATLKANGLTVVETLFPSTTVFVTRHEGPMLHHRLIPTLRELAPQLAGLFE